MLSYHFLLDIALILLFTKLLGLFTRRLHMPQVVGALLAGVVLGPAALNVLHETDFIKQLAELGVIVLMFNAGLETNITELRKAGKASFVIALIGVVVAGRASGTTALGGWIWLGARVVYLPLYWAGVPKVRTLVYMVSLVGLGMALWPLLAG